MPRIQMILVGLLWYAVWLPLLCLSEESNWRPLPRAMVVRRHASMTSPTNRWQSDVKNYGEMGKSPFNDASMSTNKQSYVPHTKYQYGIDGDWNSHHRAAGGPGGYRYSYTSGGVASDYDAMPPRSNAFRTHGNGFSYENPYNQMNLVAGTTISPPPPPPAQASNSNNHNNNGYVGRRPSMELPSYYGNNKAMVPNAFDVAKSPNVPNAFDAKPNLNNNYDAKQLPNDGSDNGFSARPNNQNGYGGKANNQNGYQGKPEEDHQSFDAKPKGGHLNGNNPYGNNANNHDNGAKHNGAANYDVMKPNVFSSNADAPFYGNFRPNVADLHQKDIVDDANKNKHHDQQQQHNDYDEDPSSQRIPSDYENDDLNYESKVPPASEQMFNDGDNDNYIDGQEQGEEQQQPPPFGPNMNSQGMPPQPASQPPPPSLSPPITNRPTFPTNRPLPPQDNNQGYQEESPKHIGHVMPVFTPSSLSSSAPPPRPPLNNNNHDHREPDVEPHRPPQMQRPEIQLPPAPPRNPAPLTEAHQNENQNGNDKPFVKDFQRPASRPLNGQRPHLPDPETHNRERPRPIPDQDIPHFRHPPRNPNQVPNFRPEPPRPEPSMRPQGNHFRDGPNNENPNGIDDPFLRMAMNVVHNTLFYGDMSHRTADMHI